MATYNDLLKKFPEMKTAIESKGGTVAVANTNPSPDEIIAGIGSIKEYKPDMLQPIIDACANVNEQINAFHYYPDENIDFIAELDTSKITNMFNMFYYCSKLTTIPLLDTSNATTMSQMFYNCSNLTTIPQLDTSKVTDMGNMFYNCFKLTTIPLLDTSNVTNMYQWFYNCSNLTTIPQLDTSKVTNMVNMFYNCRNLTTIPQLDTSKVTDTYQWFYGCSKLTTIPQLDISNATTMISTFSNCSKLTNLTLKNIKVNLQIGSGTSWGHLLTLDSLINTVKELWDYSSGDTTYTLTMGTANTAKIADVYVKLITPTAEQIAEDPNINSKMPCEVCESTDEGAMLLTDYATLKRWVIQ